MSGIQQISPWTSTNPRITVPCRRGRVTKQYHPGVRLGTSANLVDDAERRANSMPGYIHP